MRVENIDLQTHHKRTARLLLSLCALECICSMFERVDGSRLLGDVPKIGQMCLIVWMAASPPVEVSPKLGTSCRPPPITQFECFTPARVCLILGSPFIVPCLAVWNFQNAENVRVESVNRHRAYFPLVRLFQTLKNAAKV